MYVLLLFLILVLIAYLIIKSWSLALVMVPLGLFVALFGFYLKKDGSKLGGMLAMVVGLAIAVVSIINRDVSIGAFVDSIPDMITFWK